MEVPQQKQQEKEDNKGKEHAEGPALFEFSVNLWWRIKVRDENEANGRVKKHKKMRV